MPVTDNTKVLTRSLITRIVELVFNNTNVSDMTSDGMNASKLLPEKYPAEDLFLCDVSDAVLKDVSQQMEHPFYSLSKKPDITERTYRHGDNWIQITPSVAGLATIYDKDILIFAVSQMMHAINRGEKVSRRIEIKGYDFLRFSNRGNSGREYEGLVQGLKRLSGTRITTNIKTGDDEPTRTFGLIEESTVWRKDGEGRIQRIEIVLSEWLYNAIKAEQVLTLHRDYFRLRKPMERRIYELARKHCGAQREWKCGDKVLLKKSGSKSSLKQFRYLLKQISETDHLPDYHVTLEEDLAIFTSRGTVPSSQVIDEVSIPPLDPDVYDMARSAAPGWDIRTIEQEWRDWATEAPKNPEMAFLGFCKKWYEKRGRA